MRIIKSRNESNLLNVENNKVSAKELKSLETICNDFNYPINRQFENSTVMKNNKIKLGDIEIEVISPTKTKIEKFNKHLEQQLYKIFGKDYPINKKE